MPLFMYTKTMAQELVVHEHGNNLAAPQQCQGIVAGKQREVIGDLCARGLACKI